MRPTDGINRMSHVQRRSAFLGGGSFAGKGTVRRVREGGYAEWRYQRRKPIGVRGSSKSKSGEGPKCSET